MAPKEDDNMKKASKPSTKAEQITALTRIATRPNEN
jgi:hypothetical protein